MPYKECPKCKHKSGVRTIQCKCGYGFFNDDGKPKKPNKLLATPPQWNNNCEVKRHKPPPQYTTNWTNLEKGDRIKVKSDSGPRMIMSDGVDICIGHHGVFTVYKLDLNGIHAHGKHGYVFLWMGKETFSKDTGILRKPHKIRKITNAHRRY